MPESPTDRDRYWNETDGASLTIRRTFDAPRERIWKAWTDPKELEQWLCPAGFTVNFVEGTVRPGGAWRSGMRSPNGETYVVGGEYREIDEPERLAFTHAWEDDEGRLGHETLVTVTLVADGETTALTFRQEGFVSAESRDSHEERWIGVLESLSDHLRAPGSSTDILTEGDRK